MITLHTWATPNGFKVSILLEELNLPYESVAVNIGAGDQFKPEFLAISPNNRIPAIVDTDGPDGKPISIFESGAILIYLAEKTKSEFLPSDPRERYSVLEWLMWQMGGFGPMMGQAHHFRHYAPERIQYGYDRYTNEAGRLYNVLDRKLGKTPYVAGKSYSIADMAIWPWARSIERQGHSFEEFPNVERWFKEIEARPATQKGVSVLQDLKPPQMDEKAKEILFGSAQYQRR